MGTSFIEKSANTRKEIKFPVVAKSNNSNLHVLFISEYSGTVILCGNETDMLGEFSDSYLSCMDGEYWTILDSVTITFKS